MKTARPAIWIRKTPSMEAANRAVAVAFSRGPVSIRSLRHARAVLAAVSDLARWGRLPATWNTRRNAFARGHTLYNVEVADWLDRPWRLNRRSRALRVRSLAGVSAVAASK